jgi:hypothetical protein
VSSNDTREGYVLEIRRGQGEPRFLRLPRGADLQPTSVGARGDFRVDADGVLDVHAFVYFDGETLFVQSADVATPVRVNGRPASSEWSRVEPPSTLAFGDARVVFCPASQASAVSAPAAPARPAAGMRQRPPPQRAAQQMEDLPTIADVPPPGDYEDLVTERVKAPDEDATHSIPIPGGRSIPEPEESDHETTRALPLPAVVAPVARPAPPAVIVAPEETTRIAVGGPIAAPPAVAPTVAKVSPLVQLKAQWKEASLPKKAILVLLPLAFFMVIFGLDDAPAPAKKKTSPASSGSASVAQAKVTKPTATQELQEEPPPPKPATTAAAPSATGKSPQSTTTKPAERAALDAVAAGSLVPAAELYDELAKAHPENPAYKEAARILRAKTKK